MSVSLSHSTTTLPLRVLYWRETIADRLGMQESEGRLFGCTNYCAVIDKWSGIEMYAILCWQVGSNWHVQACSCIYDEDSIVLHTLGITRDSKFGKHWVDLSRNHWMIHRNGETSLNNPAVTFDGVRSMEVSGVPPVTSTHFGTKHHPNM